MNRDFIEAFNSLDTNNKRDKLNREILVIGEYLKYLEKQLGLDNEIDIYNFHPIKDKEMNDHDYFTSIYQDVFNIERELITIERLMKDVKK